MAEEESIFAKKKAPETPAATKQPAAAAAPAPAAKSGGKAGLVVTIILLAAALIAVGIVLTIVLVSQNGKDGGRKEDEKVVIRDKKDEPAKNDPKPAKDNPTIVETDHVRGKRDSKVVVVEYADPQCPGCASVTPLVDEIYEEYGDKVAFVYRHYPLSYHKNAEAAVAAIEAAGEQGYFWEMLAAVFANQIDWEYESDKDDLAEAFATIFEDAVEDGDVDQFKKDLKNDYSDKINTDKTLGRKDSVAATPTILVNGKSITIAGTRDSVKKDIKNAIEAGL